MNAQPPTHLLQHVVAKRVPRHDYDQRLCRRWRSNITPTIVVVVVVAVIAASDGSGGAAVGVGGAAAWVLTPA
jgi:hypothetical protein